MIQLKKCSKIVDPYPVTVCDEIMPEDTFAELVATFPDKLSGDRRHGDSGRYHKDCLADRHHAEWFIETLESRPAWKEFYTEIKNEFPAMCAQALDFDVTPYRRRVAFEFSSLPGDGGGLRPHPDTAKKVATAVFFMETDWKDEWGGAFEVLRHNDPEARVDLADWSDVTTVEAVHMRPRRVVFMRRTPISYHGVRAVHAPRPRRSITVNLIG